MPVNVVEISGVLAIVEQEMRLDGNDQTRPMNSRGVNENWFFLKYWRPRLLVLRITAASSRLRHPYETSVRQNVSA
jgi:hypothetical protein